jgi:hypothetical protein
MFHLDYLSCFLTVLATILLARKSWIGLLIAIVNSLIVCAIGLRTSQLGFIPANLFCICAYAFSMRSWLREQTHTNRDQARRQDMSPAMQHRTAAGTATDAAPRHSSKTNRSRARERKPRSTSGRPAGSPVVNGRRCTLLPPAVNRAPLQRSLGYDRTRDRGAFRRELTRRVEGCLAGHFKKRNVNAYANSVHLSVS